MRFALFYHSLASDWNHGNAHFLRGIVSELLAQGDVVEVFEPRDGWSRQNLLEQHGAEAVKGYRSVYPQLSSTLYDLQSLDLERALAGVDVVIAHEWNEPELIRRLGDYRREHGGSRLLFHDTHHRMVTAPGDMRNYELRHFDGVLAFGEVIREIYLERGVHRNVWTWHEAADTRVFHPLPIRQRQGDLVWIGNWGDGERTEDLREYLLEPIAQLQLAASIYGVRYPPEGQQAVAAAGATYGGWLPNYQVASVFSRFGATVHVPRRPYREQLPGIPTIRMFEALACGIPLITAPWRDTEGLFRTGQDYLLARNGEDMRRMLRQVLNEREVADELRRSGRETIRARHTCRHRVEELRSILRALGLRAPSPPTMAAGAVVPCSGPAASSLSTGPLSRDARVR